MQCVSVKAVNNINFKTLKMPERRPRRSFLAVPKLAGVDKPDPYAQPAFLPQNDLLDLYRAASSVLGTMMIAYTLNLYVEAGLPLLPA